MKKSEVGWACGMMGARRGAYKVLVGKLQGKRVLGRLRPGLEDNSRYLKEIEWGRGCGLN
jgi:hypothetical protein